MTFLLTVFFILGALSGILEKRDNRRRAKHDATVSYYKTLDKFDRELKMLEANADRFRQLHERGRY